MRTLNATVNGNVPAVRMQQLHACKYVCEVAVKLDTEDKEVEGREKDKGEEKMR